MKYFCCKDKKPYFQTPLENRKQIIKVTAYTKGKLTSPFAAHQGYYACSMWIHEVNRSLLVNFSESLSKKKSTTSLILENLCVLPAG